MFTQVDTGARAHAGRAGHRPESGQAAGRDARRPRRGAQRGPRARAASSSSTSRSSTRTRSRRPARRLRRPRPSRPDRATRTRRTHSAAAPGAARILVVDDNVDSADSLAMLLRLEGHEPGSPTTASRRSSSRCASCPTSCCSTSACRSSTATRPRGGSVRRHRAGDPPHRPHRLGPGRRPAARRTQRASTPIWSSRSTTNGCSRCSPTVERAARAPGAPESSSRGVRMSDREPPARRLAPPSGRVRPGSCSRSSPASRSTSRWRILQPFAVVILWSVVLALMFAPLHRKLLARTGRPNLSASVTLVVAVVSVLLPLGALSIAVAAEVGDLVDQAPEKWNRWAGDPALQADWPRWRADLGERFPVRRRRIDGERIKAGLTQLGESMVKRSVGLVGTVIQAVVGFVVIAFSSSSCCATPTVRDALRRLLPLTARQSDLLLRRTVEVIQASVLGVVVIAFVQGALGGVLFAILGLPSPILWGVVMALFAMVPMVGAGIVWLPAAIFLLVTGHVGKASCCSRSAPWSSARSTDFLRPLAGGGPHGAPRAGRLLLRARRPEAARHGRSVRRSRDLRHLLVAARPVPGERARRRLGSAGNRCSPSQRLVRRSTGFPSRARDRSITRPSPRS